MFIFCPFTSHLHAPLTQYHTSPSILKKRLFDTDSRAFSVTFRFDPRLTRYRLRSLMVCNTLFFLYFLDLSILLKTSLWLYMPYRHIKVVAFFAEEEINISRVSLSTKQSPVLTIQKWKVFWKHCRGRREWWLKIFLAKEEIDTFRVSLSTKHADFWRSKKGRLPLMHVKRRLNLYHTIPNLKDLTEEDLRKNCVNQHFLHIPECFLPLTGIVVIYVTLISFVGTYKEGVQVWTENGSSRFQISTNLSKTWF